MCTETLVNLSTVDYMAFPQLLALAEVDWPAGGNKVCPPGGALG